MRKLIECLYIHYQVISLYKHNFNQYTNVTIKRCFSWYILWIYWNWRQHYNIYLIKNSHLLLVRKTIWFIVYWEILTGPTHFLPVMTKDRCFFGIDWTCYGINVFYELNKSQLFVRVFLESTSANTKNVKVLPPRRKHHEALTGYGLSVESLAVRHKFDTWHSQSPWIRHSTLITPIHVVLCDSRLWFIKSNKCFSDKKNNKKV